MQVDPCWFAVEGFVTYSVHFHFILNPKCLQFAGLGGVRIVASNVTHLGCVPCFYRPDVMSSKWIGVLAGHEHPGPRDRTGATSADAATQDARGGK